MLARKIATPMSSITPVARCWVWLAKNARRVIRWRPRTLSRSSRLFRSLGILVFMALRMGSLSGSTFMIWICAMISVMQATREKMPETHATALAIWAPMAAASEVCFRLLRGALTAVHLRDLGSELQDHRGRPHRAHRHSRHLPDRAGIRAAGAAIAVPAVGFVVGPLALDRQGQQLAADDEAEEGAEDAGAVPDLVLDQLPAFHQLL